MFYRLNIFTMSGEKSTSKDKEKDKKSGNKDAKLQADMSKEPAAGVSHQEIVELVNKVGGRQAEVLRKEFSQGQAAISTEVKGLSTVMSDIAKSIQDLKTPRDPKEVHPGWTAILISYCRWVEGFSSAYYKSLVHRFSVAKHNSSGSELQTPQAWPGQ